MMWVNGEARDTIEAGDRAVQFGDGCFTTARVQQGRVQRLAAHLQRLQQGCERLMISGVDWMALERRWCRPQPAAMMAC